MKRFLALLSVFLATPTFACDHYSRLYGTATTVDFCLYNTTGTAFKTDAVYASGDVKISKDEAAEANITTGFTDEGQCYSLPLSATEMQAARIYVAIVDQTSPVWLDKCLIIETYGSSSGQHDEPTVKVSTTSTYGELTSVPGATEDLVDMIRFLYMMARNKITQTSTTQTIYRNDDSTSLGASTTSRAGGTVTRGRFQ